MYAHNACNGVVIDGNAEDIHFGVDREDKVDSFGVDPEDKVDCFGVDREDKVDSLGVDREENEEHLSVNREEGEEHDIVWWCGESLRPSSHWIVISWLYIFSWILWWF